MKGYKVFNSDWTCRGFQYEVGKTYEMDDEPIICKQGFHFCTDPKDCFKYYNFWDDIKIAEIEALGDIDKEYMYLDGKCCTNKIKIVKELSLKDAKIETETIEKSEGYLLICTILGVTPILVRPANPYEDIFRCGVSRYIKLEVIKSITFFGGRINGIS